MEKVKHCGPSMVLAIVIIGSVIGGPFLVRQIAYAQQKGRIDEARDRLASSTASGPLVDLNESFRSVARSVEPSVVHVSVRRRPGERPTNPFLRPDDQEDPFGQILPEIPEQFRDRIFPRRRVPQQPQRDNRYRQYDVPQEFGNGSGWVYKHTNGKSYVITNNHVVETADEVSLTFFDKSTAKAKVVGADPQTDIAVLEVDDPKLLHPAHLAEGPVEQGDIIFAFGSPFRFAFSMSQGVVSGTSRQLGILDKYDPNTGRPIQQGYENFIQTDAAINPGNSGGPLVNIHGQVVGMSSAIASNTGVFAGLGFAIPVDMIRDVAGTLIERGKVVRGYLGVWIRDLDPDMARTFNFEGHGVLVDDVTDPNSPAAKAGMKADDIIVSLNGKPVDTAAELRRQVARIEPGQTIDAKVFRGGKQQDLKVKLEPQPTDPRVAARQERQGLKSDAVTDDRLETLRKLGLERVTTMTQELAERTGLDYTPGVLVQEVRPASIAFSEGLRGGAIITAIQSEKVSSLEDLLGRLGKHDLKAGVRLRVAEGALSRSFVLKLPD